MAEIRTEHRLTFEEAHRLIDYNPLTGTFTCKVSEGRRIKGVVYVSRTITLEGQNYAKNRLAWFMVTGKWPEAMIDHKDRDHDNNIFTNLREATATQNQQNKFQVGKHSGLKGVTWRDRKNPWLAKIRVNGTRINLGSFETKEEAAAAYAEAAQKYHGEFACTSR